MKAKLAKYRSELLEPTGKKGESGEGFEVLKSGDARVAMIGFPSVGKVSFIFSLYYTSLATYSTQTLFKNIVLFCEIEIHLMFTADLLPINQL